MQWKFCFLASQAGQNRRQTQLSRVGCRNSAAMGREIYPRELNRVTHFQITPAEFAQMTVVQHAPVSSLS